MEGFCHGVEDISFRDGVQAALLFSSYKCEFVLMYSTAVNVCAYFDF